MPHSMRAWLTSHCLSARRSIVFEGERRQTVHLFTELTRLSGHTSRSIPKTTKQTERKTGSTTIEIFLKPRVPNGNERKTFAEQQGVRIGHVDGVRGGAGI